jgi:hypothetical protein
LLDSYFPLRQTEGASEVFFVRRFTTLLLALQAITAFAQQTTPQSPEPEDQYPQGENILTSLAGQFFHGDFVNFFGLGAGVVDHDQAISNGATGGGFGYSLGGGVQAFHRFRDSVFSVSYNAGYTDYNSAAYSSGFNQHLSLVYSKRLSTRWNIAFIEAGGTYRYGVGYSQQPDSATPAVANPFSPVTRYLSSGVTLTYRKSARLSYLMSGHFYMTRYSYPGAIGSTGGGGSGSVTYRLTERTNVGGTYSHSNFTYQHDAGQSTIDGAYFNLTHQFGQYWTVNADAGFSRSDSSGFIRIPVTIILNGQEVTGYEIGPYQLTRTTPSFRGSVSRRFRSTLATVSAGQGVTPGNGVYLTSRNQFLTGTLSYTMRKSNISASGGYFRLSSLANNVSSSYSTASFGVSYGYMLGRHIAANIRYSYYRYGNLYDYSGVGNNRIYFGLSFSTEGIPLTIY